MATHSWPYKEQSREDAIIPPTSTNSCVFSAEQLVVVTPLYTRRPSAADLALVPHVVVLYTLRSRPQLDLKVTTSIKERRKSLMSQGYGWEACEDACLTKAMCGNADNEIADVRTSYFERGRWNSSRAVINLN